MDGFSPDWVTISPNLRPKMRVIGLLIRPFYLDTDTLDDYIASIEDGLTETLATRNSGIARKGGSIGVRLAHGELHTEETGESTRSIRDHDTSKLERLITHGRENPDELNWNDVLEPSTSFPELRIGEMIEWECDVYLPELSELLTNRSLASNLRSMADLASLARIFGTPDVDFPDSAEVHQMADFLENLNMRPVLIGEDSGTDWRIVGTLHKNSIRTDNFDDRARIIAKLRRVVPGNLWFPLQIAAGLPVSREQRRRLEREGPSSPQEENQFLRGPLLVVDYLAVYI